MTYNLSSSSDFLIVLPARYDSTRLPGKPLADIGGKPMIVRSYENAKRQGGMATVIVATDDERVMAVCHEHQARCVMTNKDCRTGTDRVAEVAQYTTRPFIINYQPDEPLLEDGTIGTIMEWMSRHPDEVCCGTARIVSTTDILSVSVGKVVTDCKGRAMYMSRSPIPFCNPTNIGFYTQVCVYGFPLNSIRRFGSLAQTPMELAEGIELLRWMEMGNAVYMVTVPGERHAVDTPEDLEKIRKIFSTRVANESLPREKESCRG